VVVMGPPGLVGEMIEAAVEARPGLLLVRAPDTSDVQKAIGATDPHVLVVETSDARLAPSWLEALQARPGLRVVTLDPVRGTGILYEMRPHAVALGDVSPADIVTAIETPPRDPEVLTEASKD
jgi:hypothetical protein